MLDEQSLPGFESKSDSDESSGSEGTNPRTGSIGSVTRARSVGGSRKRAIRSNKSRKSRRPRPGPDTEVTPVQLTADQENGNGLTCTLCDTSIKDTSPIAKNLRYGNYFPWSDDRNHYHPETKECIYRTPKGRFCSFCRNTYGAGGFEHKTKKTLSQYAKECKNPLSDCAKSHNGFLIMRQKAIESGEAAHGPDQAHKRRFRSSAKNVKEARAEVTKVFQAIKSDGFKDQQ